MFHSIPPVNAASLEPTPSGTADCIVVLPVEQVLLVVELCVGNLVELEVVEPDVAEFESLVGEFGTVWLVGFEWMLLVAGVV